MKTALRMTGRQQLQLMEHLYPGDGKEAVAVALCGRRVGKNRHILTVQQIYPVPYSECRLRTQVRIESSTEILLPIVDQLKRRTWNNRAARVCNSSRNGRASRGPQVHPGRKKNQYYERQTLQKSGWLTDQRRLSSSFASSNSSAFAERRGLTLWGADSGRPIPPANAFW